MNFFEKPIYISNFRLHEMGYEVGSKILDVNYIREKGYKRETNLEKMLLFIKVNVWRVSVHFSGDQVFCKYQPADM